MKLVLCSIQQKEVKCSRNGICVRCGSSGSADLCSIREEALDKALNC